MIRKLLLAACAAASLSAAAGPVVPTTIVDGQFAADTKWYTMKITANGFYLSNQEVKGAMPLERTWSIPDFGDLWCFVGSDANGYRIYNRAEGTKKSLAAPTNPAGSDQGGSAYPTLKAPGQDGQEYLWNFVSSPNIANSYYIYEQSNSANKINNRGNRLAFWTAGADAGSSVVISLIDAATPTVDASGIITVQTSPLITLSGDVKPTVNADGTISLGNSTYYFSTPDSLVVNAATFDLPDGSFKTITSARGESNDQLPVQGPLTFSALRVMAAKVPAQSPYGYAVFRYDGTPEYNIVYRIPAITTVGAGPHKGRLIAVNDYRYCGGDIGGGRIDLHMSYSDDNGLTWSKPDDVRNAQGEPVARGTGNATPAGTKQSVTNLDCGFGDPAILSDRETGELLMVACCGRMNFFNSRRDDPQPSARWWSTDGGQTWTEPDYGQWEQIYSLFDNNCRYGCIDSQFVGSGRMVQSSRIKVGDYYRIYCVMSGRYVGDNNFSNISNWVLYSDDFGHNWHILGDPMNPAVAQGGDEPKCEELPDGSVLLAARGNGGGRNFNIFHYTDIAKAEGRWDTHINTNLGTGHGINACNGEILIVPVENTTTGQKAYMAIQSFTNSTSREKVSLAWKVLASAADYDEPADFNTWNGFFQITPMSSGYSTMTWQADDAIGVLYEEASFNGKNYSEIYRRVTIDELTDGAWKYAPDTNNTTASALQAEAVALRAAAAAAANGMVVGNLSDEGKAAVAAAAEAYAANPSDETYALFNAAELLDSNRRLPRAEALYSFLSDSKNLANYPKTDSWLSAGASALAIAKSETDATRFALIEAPEGFLIYSPSTQRYVCSTTKQTETAISTTADRTQAGVYTFTVTPGRVSIVSSTPGNASYPAIHMNSTSKPVIWTIDAAASKWVMTFIDDFDSINEVESAADADLNAPAYDLQGRRAATLRPGAIYIQNRRKFIAR
ncbi:MAG: glycoside hydrolase [Muribaculaceae bacterium]|nr:glycoside hydrolase [Muribaculaceae bacterium]